MEQDELSHNNFFITDRLALASLGRLWTYALFALQYGTQIFEHSGSEAHALVGKMF